MRLLLRKCEEMLHVGMNQSSMTKAINYFRSHYQELVAFTRNPELPIDNNSQERQLRSPVVGRKTWYGNHSKKGAEASADMFTIVESCKLNGVNPREYVAELVRAIHEGKPVFTPYEYACIKKQAPPDVPD